MSIADKPESPPSALAAAPMPEQSFSSVLQEIWINKNFLMLAASAALPFANYLTFATFVSGFFTPFGYSPEDL